MTGIHVQLDADTMSHPKILAAGAHAELLFYRGLQLAKRTLSDGRIARSQLTLLTLGLPGRPEKHAQALVDNQLWHVDGDGWVIHGFVERNKTKAQVEETRAKKAEAAALGNHERWHTAHKPGRDCSHCIASGWHHSDGVRSHPPEPKRSHTDRTVRSPSDNSASPETESETQPEAVPTTPARPEAERTGPPTDTSTVDDPKPLPPWDQARALIADAWQHDLPDEDLNGWAGAIAKVGNRIRHPYPADLGAAALVALLANRTIARLGSRPSLISHPDRARLLSQIEAVLRATPPEPDQPHVDTAALLGRWSTRLDAIAPTRPTWTPHELATRTVATWDQPDPSPTPAHPAGTGNTAAARQRARLARITEGATP